MIQFHPYSIVLALSALVTLIVFIMALQRNAPGSFALKGMLLGMFIWGFSYALSWAFVPLNYKVLCLKVMYLGMASIPGLFLLFTLRITHRDKWITFRNYILLFTEPFIISLLTWFAPNTIFKFSDLVFENGLVVIRIQRGLGFWVNTVYSYGVILLGFYLLIDGYRHANALFKRQYLLIMVGSVVPFALSILTQSLSSDLSELDMSAISFGVSGVIYAYAILRHKLMDLIPIARSRLIENMSDGVLVLDAQGRIVDINPAMKNFLEEEPSTFIGKSISDVTKHWTENTNHFFSETETRIELRLPYRPSRYLDLRATPLHDENQSLSGHLIIFRDITDRKEVEKDLRHAMDRMQTQLIEIGLLQSQLREQAIRDALTNLFNRRYLEETLERELARAAREGYPLCIVMMDIDHFKVVNDTYGHEAGDLVLKTLAKLVVSQSRQGDFVCRFGGEEFVLVMPNISIETAKERISSLHRSIAAFYIPFGQFNLNITMSMGISWYPKHGETKELLLRAADRAMYAAKNAGRNLVVVHRETSSDVN